MALTVRVAQHWLKLLPTVMSLVQGHMYDMYDSGVQMYVSFNVLVICYLFGNFYFINISLSNRYMGSHQRSILVQYSSNRRPEDGGLKTPKHVASIIAVNTKETELC
jgi:hypothetical protein